MNHTVSHRLPHRSGARLSPVICISGLLTCRCYTHLGASQDLRARQAQ
ncbi:hypothetical protein [Siccibacter turicensis]